MTVRLLNGKQLAAAMNVPRMFVTAMKARGYRFQYGHQTTLDDALAWRAANPHFRWSDYIEEHRKEPSTRRSNGKRQAQNAARESWIAKYGSRYPSPPPPQVRIDSRAILPPCSGIYFVWRDGVIRYVGRSTDISRRCRSSSHENIAYGDSLSWIKFPPSELFFAELFYIGALAPAGNLPFDDVTLAGSVGEVPAHRKTPRQPRPEQHSQLQAACI